MVINSAFLKKKKKELETVLSQLRRADSVLSSKIMVWITVKGTKFIDEFGYEANLTDVCGELAKLLTHLQNSRHRVKLQLMSVSELLETAEKAKAPLAAEYRASYESIQKASKDPKRALKPHEFDEYWTILKDLTVKMFPGECTHKEGEEAAVNHLYELHENPEIDEDYRLHVYHCRAILDPVWKQNEMLDEATTGVWFCGKVMENQETVSKYCGGNNKSRITVKLALASGSAPSGEPRMSYDEQRTLRQAFYEKRETYKTLEDSELRDAVLRQARGRVALPPSGSSVGGSDMTLNVQQLRPIYNKRDVTETSAD